VNIGRVAGGRLLAASVLASFLAAPSAAQSAPREPPASPGLLHVGPFYVTPHFRIFSLGVDTNVFYTSTDRRTDFIAHGGPGLEMLVPLHGALKFRADGTIGYLYYARTASQRRLSGDALGRLAYEGVRLTTGAQYSYARSYGRLGFEVDRRVAQEQQQAQADLRYGIGPRFAFGGRAVATRYEIDDNQEFFGPDLRRNLTRDTYGGGALLSYALSPKTSFVVEADHQADRFELDDTRDTDSNRLGAGLLVTSTTYLSGRVIAGARSIRVKSLPGEDRITPYANADLTWHFGPRTRLTAAYFRDVGFSALSVAAGDLPTLTTEAYRVRLEKGLWRRLDLRLHAGLTQLRSDAPVLIETPTEGPLSVRRDDRAREAGADLGYAFWTRLRIGLAATYSERRSPIRDLGIEGLLLGATVIFIPD
jgi:putative beta-barrel porin BBP2